ncbi:MAG: uroporphyrinogen decarboxylase family protein [Phycisphaerales bacterium]
MTRRERLMAILRGDPVDRPAVNFYEVGGFAVDPSDPDEFNVYNDPSWRPLLQLAEERSDLIRMRSAVRSRSWDPYRTLSRQAENDEFRDLVQFHKYVEGEWHCTRVTIRAGGRTLSSTTRRDAQVDTVWTTEHLLKSVEDLDAYLQLPAGFFAEQIDVAPLVEEDARIGDRGIVMVDTEDPICAAASLFDMGDFLTVAMTEPKRFHGLLEKLAPSLYARTEQVSRDFPGHLWRVYGAEYAAEPFLPPCLFREYVARYTEPMVRAIKKHGGFARIHCHGRIRAVLDAICEMGADAIDPIEPPPHGDVALDFVRRVYGERLVLFGNIELSDIESMEPAEFKRLVEQTLLDGTRGQGRGFVLMPSASPNARQVTARTTKNYETMVRLVESFRP